LSPPAFICFSAVAGMVPFSSIWRAAGRAGAQAASGCRGVCRAEACGRSDEGKLEGHRVTLISYFLPVRLSTTVSVPAPPPGVGRSRGCGADTPRGTTPAGNRQRVCSACAAQSVSRVNNAAVQHVQTCAARRGAAIQVPS